MASNKELTEQAHSLAKQLDIEVATHGLNNARLVALVAELQGKLASKPVVEAQPERPHIATTEAAVAALVDGAKPAGAGGPPASKPAPAPPLLHAFQVAPRKALTTARGIRGPGAELVASDVEGGLERLEYLVTRGLVVRGPSAP
jgi:hypothetical protein